VLTLPRVFVDEPTRYTLQVEHRRHVDTGGDLSGLVNHSCRPNCVFAVEQHALVALRPIAAGDEITINYLASELALARPFECSCGSLGCVGQVLGFEHLDAARRAALGPLSTPFLATLPLVEPAESGAVWWRSEELDLDARGLLLEGCSVAELAAQHGTPLYIYSASAIRRRFQELRTALAVTGAPFRISYAVKANRFRPVLDLVRQEGDVGIDACSPREVALALEVGFAPDEISVTPSMPSNRDLAAYAAAGVHLNLDTRSALARWAATPGRSPRVGLRLDPEVAIGYRNDARLAYADGKFGFPSAEVPGAAELAVRLGLDVDELHVHVGWGLQEASHVALGQVYGRLAALAELLPSVRVVNTGGGLYWRQQRDERPLTPVSWSALLQTHLASLGRTIACEPGTYPLASAGLLVSEVNTVERRGSVTWLGLDAGQNVNSYAAHYGIPHEIIHVGRPLAPVALSCNVAGNINEGIDVFARDTALPEVREGDLLALFPAGAYGSSMASEHCLRPLAKEVMIG
jgi:diaminopimelate decarboxylase